MIQSSPDIESLRIGLDAVASQIRSWLDWNRKHREDNDPPLKTDDGTSIMCLPVPYWPSHGAFENWIKLFEDCRAALSPSSAGIENAVQKLEWQAEKIAEQDDELQRLRRDAAQPSAGSDDGCSPFDAVLLSQCKLGDYCKCCAGKPRLCPNYEGPNALAQAPSLFDKPAIAPGDIDGLYGRIPPIFQKLVRKIADAPNYDFAAMELLDAFEIEWRKRS